MTGKEEAQALTYAIYRMEADLAKAAATTGEHVHLYVAIATLRKLRWQILVEMQGERPPAH